MNERPKIGITTRLDLANRRFYIGRDYAEAVENFEAIPVLISLIPKKAYIENLCENLDGILLPGNDSDVDPLIYGEQPHKNLGTVIPEKDSTDLIILEKAEKLNLPILAICYGMQILNVQRGGSLIQDISSQVENPIKHEQGRPLERNSHSLEIKKETKLARLITEKKLDVENVRANSHHHQSVRQIGENLRANAFANDKVVEGIEDSREDRFVLGVQWHPELSWKTDALSNCIFEQFVKKCSEFANRKK